MRRSRRHRLTGSPRRLLAAAALSVFAVGGFGTVASAAAGPSSAGTALQSVPVVGGLLGSLTSPLLSLAASTLPPLPIVSQLPSSPALPPVLGDCVVLCPPVPTPTLPTVPPVSAAPIVGQQCPPFCPTSGGGGNTPGGGTPRSNPTAPTGVAPSASAGSSVVVGPGQGRSGGPGSGASSSTGGAAILAGGLDLAQPPPVEQLTPLAGISFGQAPYVWPLFLLLDVVAAFAVVIAVRKTWSASGVD
jgi:hypothetical protein